MADLSILGEFCADEPGRYNLDVPWVFGGWKYYCNGYAVARVLATDEPDATGEHPARIADVFSAADVCDKPMPAHGGKCSTEPCPVCDGHKRTPVECEVCRGDGDCHCPTCGDSHECGNCGGAGRVFRGDKCPRCKGTGRVSIPAHQQIDGHEFDGRFVTLLNRIGDGLYCIALQDTGHKLLYRTTDGTVEAALMARE